MANVVENAMVDDIHPRFELEGTSPGDRNLTEILQQGVRQAAQPYKLESRSKPTV